MNNNVMIVDDDLDFVSLLSKYLTSQGLNITTSGSANEAVAKVKESHPEVILVDVKLPDQSGVELVGTLKSIDENCSVIMVSGYGEPKLIVSAIQAGASDYITKPVDNKELMTKINGILELRRKITLEKEIGGCGLILGISTQTKQLIHEIGRVADSNAPVLLRGESGTGKTLVAQIIHSLSPRNKHPFVVINCPAIPRNLLESELFGHVKGSFTGAIVDKIGKMETADQGTVFLDEIGDLYPELQAKLLRVIQGHEFERVGGLKTFKIDVRVIAATNQDLEVEIKEHRFREDLFYRLNVLPIYIPPLRERPEDIPILVKHFIKEYSQTANKKFDELPDRILQMLTNYSWPGNVRELQNIIERAIILGKEPELKESDFVISDAPLSTKLESSEVASLKDMEHETLINALQKTGGNISKTAKILGIGRDTVYRRLKKYKIDLKN
ncbi:MAG: sigma-54 dependent transcriptional regulator [Pseudomonadota bacterium]